jgi:sulfide:quinone oxidoreductase
MKTNYPIVIIGGGTAGIMLAAQLRKKDKTLQIALVEPSDTHWYQPAWTLVGANTYAMEKTKKPMAEMIPKGVNWIREKVVQVNPVENTLDLSNGNSLSYEYLIVAPGLIVDNSLVEGLEEAMDKGSVCSVYTDPEHTWQVLKNFKGGTALFTLANTPIKCGGAPQKIMYLAEEHFRKAGLAKNTDILFAMPGSVLFGVSPIVESLYEVVDRKNIGLKFGYALEKVEGDKKIAWFKKINNLEDYNPKDIQELKEGERIGIPYDMMHLAPPQRTPDFIYHSSLANASGWLEVDIHTLQHKKFKNIYGLGDVAALPTAKTGAAIRKQVPVVVGQLLSALSGAPKSDKKYNGYSSCPLVTGYGSMLLAEFDYDSKFTPDPQLKKMLIFDSHKEHWRLWMLKKYGLPYLYWNKMMKGQEV